MKTMELTKNQKRTMRRDLIEVGRNPEKTMRLNDEELHRAYVVEGSKIEELHAKRAEQEALMALRMAERAMQQKEQARRDAIHTDKAMLRAKREAQEREAINRHHYTPLPRIGPSQDQIDQLEIIEEIAKVERDIAAKAAVLRNPNLSNAQRAETEVAYANAILYRNGIKSATPEVLRRNIDLNFYLKHTVRNVTGSASFQK